MGLDIYFREDIRNALLAADAATAACGVTVGAQDEDLRRAYLAGYRACLVTIALAFGINPRTVTGFVSNETEGENEETEGESWTVGG